jgi:ribosomal protein L3
MVDVRRKGSLAWYHNSKRGLSTLVPSLGLSEHAYYVKAGMSTIRTPEYITPVTYLRRIPLEKEKENYFKLKFSELDVKRTRKQDMYRVIKAENTEDLVNTIQSSDYVDVIGLTKGRGTCGPITRRKIKKGKRKALRSYSARRPGSMGIRSQAKIDWRKPFSGKHGNSQRTILNLKVEKVQKIQNLLMHKYFSKVGDYLVVRGSVSGPTNRILAVRRAIRK